MSFAEEPRLDFAGERDEGRPRGAKCAKCANAQIQNCVILREHVFERGPAF